MMSPRSVGRAYRRRWLDRYYLCEPIASGGMATVHAALAVGDAGFHRLVAIKLMHPHLLEQRGFVTMFEDEARISAYIRHPFVAAVIDHGLHEGEAFLAMEYLDGLTFHALIRRWRQAPDLAAPERWRWALRLVADACEGLHAAHEARGADGELLGVVHRDVTPSNLFVCRDGTARVVDFGVVKALGRQQLTETGAFKGKLAYMAPEYLRTGRVDRRADIFALGLVLQEMLSLRRAYGTSEESLLLQRVLVGEVLSLRGLIEGLPAALERAVSRAIHPSPDERYPTARAFGLALDKALAELGDPFPLGTSAEAIERLLPAGESRIEALLGVYPEAWASRSGSRSAPRLLSAAPEVPGAPAQVPEGGATSGTLRAAVGASPAKAGPSRALLALFVASALGGAAVTSTRLFSRAEAPRQPHTAPEVAAPQPPSASSSDNSTIPSQVSSGEAPSSSRAAPGAAPRATGSRLVVPGSASAVGGPHQARQGEGASTGETQVTVSSPGGVARVYWQGIARGVTPCTLALPPGRHTLELEPPDAPRRPVMVEVRGGEPVYVSVPIARLLPPP